MTDDAKQVRLRLSDTWHSRDLPVLVQIAATADGLGTIRLAKVTESTGLTEQNVMAAIQALVHAGLLHEDRNQVKYADNQIYLTFPGWLVPSERGRREVGLWPSEETVFDRMVEQLEAIAADVAADDDTRGRAQRALDSFVGGGKSIGLSVAAAVITGQLT